MAKAKSMCAVTKTGTHLEQLENLALVIAARLDDKNETCSTAQLARQYRETLNEIEAIKDMQDDGDGLGNILG